MALKKYYAIVVMNAHTLSNVPESVCIYDTRFTFAISLENDNNVIDFEPCPPLLQVETVDVEQSVHAININPLMLFIRPVRVVLDENEKMYRSIVDPLSDDQERFLMWLIGCSLIDGLQQARLLIFYGKSGMEGKTTLMKNIENMLTGTVSTFTRNPFVAKEQILTVQEMHEMSASRICLFDEGDYDKGFNISNVKKLVSGFLYHVSVIGRLYTVTSDPVLIYTFNFSHSYSCPDENINVYMRTGSLVVCTLSPVIQFSYTHLIFPCTITQVENIIVYMRTGSLASL